MSTVRRPKRKLDRLETQLDTLDEKIKRLRIEHARETDVARKLQLEQQINEAEAEGNEIEQQIEEIEVQIRQRENLTGPEPTPFIPFANRQGEWERIVLYPEGQYYLFEGPEGYGKTALLKKLDEEFNRRNWFCVYVSLQEHATVTQVANHIAEKLQLQANVLVEEHRRIGWEIGKSIAQRREIEGSKGLVLLFDVEHEPWESLTRTLQSVVEDFIPGVYDGLIRNSNHFKETPLTFRIVVAGRYLISRIEKLEHAYKFDAIQLKPFDYEVVRDICGNYIRDAEERNEFAANLLFYSGGHPRCMVRILQRFDDVGDSPTPFFISYRTDIERIALLEANWVYNSIVRDWRRLFDTLCVYRRLDHFLLQQLFDKGLVWHGMVKDEYDLADRLKLSYLMDWADELHAHLSDSIARRLLLIRLRYDIDASQFQEKCGQAAGHCLECLDRTVEYSSYWAVEALFEYLQGNVARIYDKAERQNMHRQFFEVKLPEVLSKLGKRREPRLQKESLCGILAEDWEFQFTLNYYLRADHYDETPYEDMLRHIEQFC